VFSGHITGTFGQTQGKGQSIVTNGRITDNWHSEDNLTLMKQLGLVSQ
jgi:hypothetical protein